MSDGEPVAITTGIGNEAIALAADETSSENVVDAVDETLSGAQFYETAERRLAHVDKGGDFRQFYILF